MNFRVLKNWSESWKSPGNLFLRRVWNLLKEKVLDCSFIWFFLVWAEHFLGGERYRKSYYKCLPYKKSKNKSLARKHIECYKCILIRVRTLLEIIQAMTKMHLNALRNAGPDIRQTDRQMGRQTERQPLFIKHNKNSVVCVILHNTGYWNDVHDNTVHLKFQ